MAETKSTKENIPEGWVETTLGEVVDILDGDRGKNYPNGDDFSEDGFCLFLNTKNVPNTEFSFSNTSFITLEKDSALRKGKLSRGDFVLTTRGTIGNFAYYSNIIPFDNIRINSGMVILRKKDNLYDLFLKHYLAGSIFKHQVLSLQSGSAQPQLPIRDLRFFEVILPPPPEQRAIANVLSSFDDKIELLREQNKTLEQTAQTIFKEWFGKYSVDRPEELPEGWRVGKLNEIVENIKETLTPGDDLTGRKYIPIDEIPMKRIGLDSYKPIEDAKSSLIGFEPGDILFGAMRSYFHRVNFSTIKGVTRTTTMVLRPKNEEILPFALFLINQEETVNFANVNSKGSTMPYAVWNDTLENMHIIIPSKKEITKYFDLIIPMLNKISGNIIQSQFLEKTRDTLLPKLMKGEVRVNLD